MSAVSLLRLLVLAGVLGDGVRLSIKPRHFGPSALRCLSSMHSNDVRSAGPKIFISDEAA